MHFFSPTQTVGCLAGTLTFAEAGRARANKDDVRRLNAVRDGEIVFIYILLVGGDDRFEQENNAAPRLFLDLIY